MGRVHFAGPVARARPGPSATPVRSCCQWGIIDYWAGEAWVTDNGVAGHSMANVVGTSAQAVGRVLGTQAASPLSFWVGLEPGRVLQLDDVVVTRREVPGHGPVLIAGVVTEVEARHEGASFDSDVFLIADGALPAAVVECAEVRITRVEPEVFVPPLPGSPVYRAEGDDREQALYFDVMDRRIPMGLGRDGRPLYVNFDFLDGTRGAHVSISGVSGVATKTSFATFLLYSIFNSGVLEGEAANTKALIFSVKGEDLLFLDHANTRLDDGARGAYGRLGLPARPFGSVHVFAPPRPGDPIGVPHVSASRRRASSAFYWTLAQFCEQELLRYVFADADDERSAVLPAHRPGRRQVAVLGAAGGRRRRGLDRRGRRERRAGLPHLRRSGRLRRRATRRRGHAFDLGGLAHPARHGERLPAAAAQLRPAALADHPGRPAAGQGPLGQHLRQRQVTIVDLHNLPERAQRFVVGVVLRGEFDRKEKHGHGQAAAVRGARRAQQVRPARGRLADQGDPARHRRAGPLARSHPDRRPADRVARSSGASCPTAPSGSPGGSTPPRPRVRSTDSCPPASGSAPRSPSRAPCSSPSRRSPCRSR